jgi:diguanylate cyclase (GGDEF)-like protein
MPKQHVLIIDDDKDIANLFHMVLSMVGFDCDIVNSAKAGLSKLSVSEPDIVLLDLRLGLEIGGEDILYQIRSNPRLRHTKVIVITGYPALAEPISDLTDLILIKPIEVDQLKTLIQRLATTDQQPRQVYFRDPATGLYNQEFYFTRLEHAFQRTRRRPDFIYAAVVFTIDFRPQAADSNWSRVMDNIFREVGWRLVKNFRPTDTVARFSNNKFATLHEDLKQPQDVVVITDRMQIELMRPYQVDKKTFWPELAIGAAVHQPNYMTPREILDAAERSLAPAGAQELTNQ